MPWYWLPLRAVAVHASIGGLATGLASHCVAGILYCHARLLTPLDRTRAFRLLICCFYSKTVDKKTLMLQYIMQIIRQNKKSHMKRTLTGTLCLTVREIYTSFWQRGTVYFSHCWPYSFKRKYCCLRQDPLAKLTITISCWIAWGAVFTIYVFFDGLQMAGKCQILKLCWLGVKYNRNISFTP